MIQLTIKNFDDYLSQVQHEMQEAQSKPYNLLLTYSKHVELQKSVTATQKANEILSLLSNWFNQNFELDEPEPEINKQINEPINEPKTLINEVVKEAINEAIETHEVLSQEKKKMFENILSDRDMIREIYGCDGKYMNDKIDFVLISHNRLGFPLTKPAIKTEFARKFGDGVGEFVRFLIKETNTKASISTVQNFISIIINNDLAIYNK